MYQFFIEPDQAAREYVTITGKDVHHIRDVIRLSAGEEIRVSVRDGESYLCRITELGDSFVQADILGEANSTELPVPVTLFQGIPKGDRMETVIEKAVELGVSRIVPVEMRFCVVRLSSDRAVKKVKKWQELAEAAAKQSKRSVVPEVAGITPFDKAAEELLSTELPLVPYENETGMNGWKAVAKKLKEASSVGILIGPEGGFAMEEIRALDTKAELVSLGRRILRTDTAAITALSAVMLSLESLS
ncbi:MAG: 16S rRNA (uracil(1498)-N(3))-methyltransferase [Lachnospiraceae bacterium]|nr:16S rRNA (uracil(1498)-N(3))-methyltransferase [Lachnospiraceae bacterium]